MVWHILIVEADANLNQELVNHLRYEGFEAAGVRDGGSALDFIEREGLPHLALIDLALPDVGALELVQDLSQRGAPVIATADNGPQLAVEFLRWADDFVRKPYDKAELVARIRRVLGRIADYSYARSPRLEIDQQVSFDYAHNRLIVKGQPVQLTPIESQLLHTLMQHRGRVVASQTLLVHVWPMGGGSEETLRVHMHRLRKKLEADPRNPEYILTERGGGYSFRP